MQDDSFPVLQLPRVLGLERADTSRALDDSMFCPKYPSVRTLVQGGGSHVRDRRGNLRWLHHTGRADALPRIQHARLRPRLGAACAPRREEYRRTDGSVCAACDEARRVVAAEPDMALPAHWEGAMNTAEVRLEIISFLLEHDCKMKRIPQFSGEDVALNIEMAAELELRRVRENPVHIVKFCKFDSCDGIRRILEIAEERIHCHSMLASNDPAVG